MRHERAGHALQASALVNEAYLRLIQIKQVQWQDRLHFMAMASRIMRRILVESARGKGFQKRGAGAQRVSLDEGLLVEEGPSPDLIALDVALNTLEKLDPRKCKVVEMRFFAGLSVEETAEALHVSIGTIMSDWRMAKSWLARELESLQHDDARTLGDS
jgi:RNA polymerase sigma factor (TIGR02999 family)